MNLKIPYLATKMNQCQWRPKKELHMTDLCHGPQSPLSQMKSQNPDPMKSLFFQHWDASELTLCDQESQIFQVTYSF